MLDHLNQLVHARRGHFLLESGHHGDLWLDLETLCLHPGRIRSLAAELAQRVAGHKIDATCGPLNEGAFVALLVALELDVQFFYAERFEDPTSESLFPVKYRMPAALRSKVRGKRVAIINDVINAGSAIRGTCADLRDCGAVPVALGALVVLGDFASSYAADENLALESITFLENNLWTPAECPLCAAGKPLENN